MSKLSIYETAWIDLVFEGKNKEYGAYQLRREHPQTSIKALFTALMLIAALVTIPMIINAFSGRTVVPTIPKIIETITPFEYHEPPKNQEPPQKSSAPPAAETPDKPSMEKPVVTEADKAAPDLPTQKEMSAPSPSTGSENGTGIDPTASTGGNETAPTTTFIDNGPQPMSKLDKMPAYPGGIENFYKYVGRNFKTPEDELESGTMIRVVVSFVIEKDGTMTDIKVIQNPGYGLDKEAIRVLKSLKVKWAPGYIAGQPVRTAYNLPIAVKAP